VAMAMRLLLSVSLLLLAINAQAKWHSENQDVMGTRVSVMFWLEDDAKAAEALAAVMAEMHRIDHHFSPFIETSELSRANQQAVRATADKPLTISPELTSLIDRSLYYGDLSDGAFDITFASLARYYDTNILTHSNSGAVFIAYRSLAIAWQRFAVAQRQPDVEWRAREYRLHLVGCWQLCRGAERQWQ